MNYSTQTIGDKTSVISRLTSPSAAVRPCKLLNVEAENYTGGLLYLQYFDGLTAVPDNGTVPDEGFPVAANYTGSLGQERDISGGIWVWSTTETTLTAVVANSGAIKIFLKA